MAEVLNSLADLIDIATMYKTVDALSQYDRYQASQGICAAADYLNHHLSQLKNFSVQQYLFTNLQTSWWTFDAPKSWTPINATIELFNGKERICHIDHQVQPFSIATYSLAWNKNIPIPKVVIFDSKQPCYSRYKDALVIILKSSESFANTLSFLEDAGALGFLTDHYTKTVHQQAFVGRIELSQDTRLFGFSTTTEVIVSLISRLQHSSHAIVNIEIDRDAPMPVLDAFFDTGATQEIYLVAHLCHPRPSANDNLSGVAALLEVARGLDSLRKKFHTPLYSIRFLFVPEFTGIAAYLHDIIQTQNRPYPKFVINVDMVGGDIQQSGSQFYIERPPVQHISYHQAVLEMSAERLSSQKNANWQYQISEFCGYSDHAIFADCSIGVPATQLCNFPDYYNHSCGDTIDKMDFKQLKNVGVLILSTLWSLLTSSSDELEQSVLSWLKINNQTLLRVQQPSIPKSSIKNKQALKRQWSGPFNPRSFIHSLPIEHKSFVLSCIEQKKKNYSILLQLGISVNNEQTREELLAELATKLKTDAEKKFANNILDMMLETGYLLT